MKIKIRKKTFRVIIMVRFLESRFMSEMRFITAMMTTMMKMKMMNV